MRVSPSSILALLAASVAVGSARAQGNPLANAAAKYAKRSVAPPARRLLVKDVPSTKMFLDDKTAAFAVNGSALPDVPFNIGESYAGSLPISSDPKDTNTLWFWFFPSSNPAACKEIVIWLNGGPGCSSLDGLFQENGPFLWQSGTFAPYQNSYSWVNLTNVVYIDQPISTGFSRGTKPVRDEEDVASQFMGFWKNFFDTFSMHGYKVYIVGESFAGQYIPYIAGAMLDTKDTTYFDVKGVQINDPAISYPEIMTQAPSVPHLLAYNNVMNLNETFIKNITAKWESCGYADTFYKYTTTFPPPGPIPLNPKAQSLECDIYNAIYTAIYNVNPCFNIYHLTDFCPYLWDEMGFPSLGAGPNDYFNRSDVQAAINAPPTNYYVCKAGSNLFPLPGGDPSPPSAIGPLASVIERTNNTIIGHGLLDFLVFANGSLLAIQNLTWNGAQGFQKAPSAVQNFYVPYHQSLGEILEYANQGDTFAPPQTDTAGAGFQGFTHTERGLTFVTVALAGHQIPQYTPGAAYRQLEFLLGRIKSLETRGDYTTQTGDFTKRSAM